jgi:hypothetical protein
VVSIERPSFKDFKDVSAGWFLYFQSGVIFSFAKFIQRHIIGKNWHFFLEWASNISFLLLKKTTFYGHLCLECPCCARPCCARPRSARPHHARPHHHGYVMHAHVMPAHAVHCMPYVRINRDMPTVTIGHKPV